MLKTPLPLFALTAVVALTFSAPTHAVHVTTLANTTSYPMPYINYVGSGPVVMGPGVTWSSNSSQTLYGYGGNYGFTTNGYWQAPMPFAATNAASGAVMRFNFATPVAGVGALMNHVPGMSPAPTVAIYDSANVLLESYVLNVVTPANSQNAGEFHGFLRPTAEISYMTLTGSYIAATRLVSAPVSAVPEPATGVSMVAGLLVALGLKARRKRTSSLVRAQSRT
jgi:hypothetical protein